MSTHNNGSKDNVPNSLSVFEQRRLDSQEVQTTLEITSPVSSEEKEILFSEDDLGELRKMEISENNVVLSAATLCSFSVLRKCLPKIGVSTISKEFITFKDHGISAGIKLLSNMKNALAIAAKNMGGKSADKGLEKIIKIIKPSVAQSAVVMVSLLKKKSIIITEDMATTLITLSVMSGEIQFNNLASMLFSVDDEGNVTGVTSMSSIMSMAIQAIPNNL